MMEGDWTLKSHFLDGSVPEEILQALMLHENGQSSQAVEIERGRERERENISASSSFNAGQCLCG